MFSNDACTKKLTVSRNRIYSSTTGIKPIPINNVKKYRTKRSDRTRFMAATSKHKDADYRHLPTNHGNLKNLFNSTSRSSTLLQRYRNLPQITTNYLLVYHQNIQIFKRLCPRNCLTFLLNLP